MDRTPLSLSATSEQKSQNESYRVFLPTLPWFLGIVSITPKWIAEPLCAITLLEPPNAKASLGHFRPERDFNKNTVSQHTDMLLPASQHRHRPPPRLHRHRQRSHATGAAPCQVADPNEFVRIQASLEQRRG